VYERISSDVGRDVFRRLYGVPNLDAPLKLVLARVDGSTAQQHKVVDDEPDFAIYPPPCTPMRVPIGVCVPIDLPLSRLLEAVHAARATLQHRDFVGALTSILPHASKLTVADVVTLVEGAYGVEAVELVATLAGRWVHTHRPSTVERRRVGHVLRDRVLAIHVDATAIASALVLEPHPTLWAALAERHAILPLFEILRHEMSARPSALVSTLEQSVRTDDAPRAWVAELAAMRSDEPCACMDCRHDGH
jgi:hypothetical protein